MTFGEAWKHMLSGEKVRRAAWKGYWAWENETIMIHCKDGRVLDIRQTEDPEFTFGNIAVDDWETETAEALTLNPPWVLFRKKLEALFKDDPDIAIEVDDDVHVIKLYVNGNEKADALTQLLPTERKIGNIVVKVEVVPANLGKPSKLQLFQKAFDGNPALAYIHEASGIFDFNYIVFRGRVVQYQSDNIGDVNGLTSTLYEEIARDVFEEDPGIFFCTDKIE